MKTLRSLLYCSLIVALLLGAPLTAQDIVLTEFYAPADAHLTLYYPAGWDAEFAHGLMMLANDGEAIAWYRAQPLMPGQAVIEIHDPAQVAAEQGTTVAAVADALSATTPMTERIAVRVQHNAALRLVESDARLYVVFSLEARQVTYATLVTRAGERENYLDIFFAVLEQVAPAEPEAEAADAGIEHQLRTRLNGSYEGNSLIPLTFNYPEGWFVSDEFFDRSVYVSNMENYTENVGADTVALQIQVFPQAIPDPLHFRDMIEVRYWRRNLYFPAPLFFGQAEFAGLYGVLSGQDARAYELGYFFNADLVFGNGLVFVGAVAGWNREYAEDEALLFDIIKTVRVTD